MTVWEIAEFTITAGSEQLFEDRARASLDIFTAAGALALELHRAIDRPSTFLLMVEWESVEQHTEVFTQTAGFAEWVARVEPLYAADPIVYHTERVIDSL